MRPPAANQTQKRPQLHAAEAVPGADPDISNRTVTQDSTRVKEFLPRRRRRLRMSVKLEQPERETHLGEGLARMLYPEFFAVADDLEAAIAAADRAMDTDKELNAEPDLVDRRIQELQEELAALQALRDSA